MDALGRSIGNPLAPLAPWLPNWPTKAIALRARRLRVPTLQIEYKTRAKLRTELGWLRPENFITPHF